MSIADYGLIILIMIGVLRAILFIYSQSKKGKCFGCGGDCSSCRKVIDRKNVSM